jgi:putative membrane protein
MKSLLGKFLTKESVMRKLFGTMAAMSLVFAAGIAQAAPLSDAEILGLANTANNAEIDAGTVAAASGQKAEVKAFGAKMVAEHTANNAKIDAVELKSSIKRVESDASRALKEESDKMIDGLKKTRSADFDRAYIDGQVTMHQGLLDKLDKELIPNAQNADIKAYLVDSRASVEAHLTEAKAIQAGLTTP